MRFRFADYCIDFDSYILIIQQLSYRCLMDTLRVAQDLESLSSSVRLDVILVLIRSGRNGLVAGEIASQVGVTPTNLSFHLRSLVSSRLIFAVREGRFLRYMINAEKLVTLIDLLESELSHPLSKNMSKATSRKVKK